MSSAPANNIFARQTSFARRAARSLGVSFGLATVAVGLVVLLWPTATLVVLAVLLGIQLIVFGAWRTVQAAALLVAPGPLRVLGALLGVLAMVAGVLLIASPFSSLEVLVAILGVGWIIAGVSGISFGLGGGGDLTGMPVVIGVLAVLGGVIVLACISLLSLVTLAQTAGWIMLVIGVVEVALVLRNT